MSPLLRHLRRLRLLAWLLAVGCATSRNTPEPLPASTAMDPDTVVVMLHGYISSAAQFTALQEPLQRGGPGDAPLHVHSFDYGQFSRVGFDHNLSTERLGEVFAETIAHLPDHCEICAERADRATDMVLIARSYGGLILREALMGEQPVVPEGWRIRSVMTLATPWFGSEMTRYSVGFLSVVINGGIRTALFGFIRPDRGGTFGNVIDAQVRAMRLGSPYQVHAHDRWKAFTDAGKAPRWALVTGVGSADPVNKGDKVLRFSAVNAAPLYPGWDTETMVIDVRHSRLFNSPPTRREARELNQLQRVIRRYVDHPRLSGQPGLSNRSPVPGRELWTFDNSNANAKVAELVRGDRGDVWLRMWAGRPGDARPLRPKRDLGAFQVGEEWSRRWQELRFETEQTADGREVPTVLQAGPLSSHMVFMPDLTPSGRWTVEVEVPEGWLPSERVHANPQTGGPTVDVVALQNNVVDVFVDVPKDTELRGLRFVPEDGRDRR